MGSFSVGRPETGEYGAAFGKYIGLTPDGDVREFLKSQLAEATALLRSVPESDSLVLHAPYTWTLRQVLGHIIDAERIFGCRALRIARNDATPLPSFDENDYVKFADFNQYPLQELLEEFELVRRSHLLMFRHLESEAWTRRGVVSNMPISVRALAYVIAGHAKHHLDVVRNRLAAG
jgi:hypothetical protein